jgi:hypothetical protein
MALNKNKLVQGFIDIFDVSKSSPRTVEESAERMEKAFMNYIMDVTLEVYLPGVNPALVPPTPDPTYLPTNFFKPIIPLESSPEIRAGLLQSFKSNITKENPNWEEANLGFKSFVLKLISYETLDQYKAIGIIVPGNIELLEVFEGGKYYSTMNEAAQKLADHLHNFVTSTEFQGSYLKGVFVNPESLTGNLYKSNLI